MAANDEIAVVRAVRNAKENRTFIQLLILGRVCIGNVGVLTILNWNKLSICVTHDRTERQ